MRILVIDVGGHNVKLRHPGQRTVVKIPSGPELTAARMVRAVKHAAADWKYDAVSIGYPGPVANGRPAREPHNLGRRVGALRLPRPHSANRSACSTTPPCRRLAAIMADACSIWGSAPGSDRRS